MSTQNFESYTTTLNLAGSTYSFIIADKMSEQWYCGEDWSGRAELRWLLDRMVEPGDVVLQCGAHHGAFSLPIASKLRGTGKIYCVEAHPRNAEVLAKNIKINGFDNTRVISAAVGGKEGSVVLVDASNASVVGARSALPKVEVPMRTLDDLCSELGLTPSLIMLDIEGCEVEALEAAQKTLSSRPKLAIEVHAEEVKNRFGRDPQRILELIPEDYDLYIQEDEHRQYPKPADRSIRLGGKVHLYALPR